jgi:hypothetical protein
VLKLSTKANIHVCMQIQADHVRFALTAMGVRHVTIKDSFAEMRRLLKLRESEIRETLAEHEDVPIRTRLETPANNTLSLSWLSWPASEAIESDDDEALLREVEEEEDLDTLDQEAEQRYEMLLWEEISRPK